MNEFRDRKPATKAFLNVGLLFFTDMVLMVIWSIIIFAGYNAYTAARLGVRPSIETLLEMMAASPQALLLSCFYNLFAIALIFLFWRYVEKDSPERIGLGWRKNSLKLFGIGGIAAACEIALVILFGMLSGVLWYEQSGFALYTAKQLGDSILFGALAFILVGFGEEVVFRGYILKRLTLSMNRWIALLFSAGIFAAAHLLTYSKPLDFMDVALGGIIMGYLYILTDSIFLPAGYHFVTDLLQVNILKLQHYEGYKGAVFFIFGNAGDFERLGLNWGSTVEVAFVAAELSILLILFLARNRIRLLAKSNQFS